jgi:hypothetical protein
MIAAIAHTFDGMMWSAAESSAPPRPYLEVRPAGVLEQIGTAHVR